MVTGLPSIIYTEYRVVLNINDVTQINNLYRFKLKNIYFDMYSK